MKFDDRWHKFIVFIVSFLVYLKTMAPTIWWGDTGDFISSAYVLGVPHPTGYPTYTLLAKLFTFLPFGDIAFRVNLMSVVFGALTVMFVYLCAVKLTKSKLAGYIAAFSLAFSGIFWSQALIAEVYVLNAFFIVSCLYLLLLWRETREVKYCLLFGLLLGFGVGVHRLMLLFIIPFLFFIFLNKRVNKKHLLLGFLFFLIGASVYAYLPLASLRQPIQDWGNPENLDNFLWLVKGEQYTQLYLKSEGFIARFSKSMTFLVSQFIFLGFALIGVYYFFKKDWKFLIFSGIAVGLNFLSAALYSIPDIMVYYIPAYILFSIFIGSGIAYLCNVYLKGKVKTLVEVLIILLISIGSFAVFYNEVNLSNDFSAREFGENAFSVVEEDSILLAKSDAVFIFWYLQNVEGMRPDVRVISQVMLPMQWYRDLISRKYPGLVIKEDIDEFLEVNQKDGKAYYVDLNFSKMTYKDLSKQLPSEI